MSQDDADAGVVRNTAVATGTDPRGATVNSPASSATVTIAGAPSLTVVKTAAPTVVSAAGQRITYSFLVTNTGNVTLTGVSIDDRLAAPAGPALVVACPADPVAPGSSTTCTAGYVVTLGDMNAGAISNTATASGTAPGGRRPPRRRRPPPSGRRPARRCRSSRAPRRPR